MAISSYRDRATLDIARGKNSKEARKRLSSELHTIARRRLAFLAAVRSLQDLKQRAGLGLHQLKADRTGQYAIKINDKYRICFIWTGQDADEVEVIDYH